MRGNNFGSIKYSYNRKRVQYGRDYAEQKKQFRVLPCYSELLCSGVWQRILECENKKIQKSLKLAEVWFSLRVLQMPWKCQVGLLTTTPSRQMWVEHILTYYTVSVLLSCDAKRGIGEERHMGRSAVEQADRLRAMTIDNAGWRNVNRVDPRH